MSHLGYGFLGWLILERTCWEKKALGPDPQMNRKRGEGISWMKGGKEGWGFVLGGPPCAALERREMKKVTLSNLFYLFILRSRARESQYDWCALVFPTKLSTFFSFSFYRLSPTLWLQWWEQPLHSDAPMNKSSPPYFTLFRIVVDPSGVRFVTESYVHAVIFYLSKSTILYVVYVWGAYFTGGGREVPQPR